MEREVLFSLVCGLLVAEILREFGYFLNGLFFLFLPLSSLFFLFFAKYFERKILFVYQAAKHILVGVFATIIDLKVFEFLFWLSNLSITVKTVSFILASFVKYLGNKFWTFGKIETKISKEEYGKFLITNLIGLLIDVSCFAFLIRIVSPPIFVLDMEWKKISVLVSAIIAGIWNFCGDKFFVFKK